jgi:hypothetical protein
MNEDEYHGQYWDNSPNLSSTIVASITWSIIPLIIGCVLLVTYLDNGGMLLLIFTTIFLLIAGFLFIVWWWIYLSYLMVKRFKWLVEPYEEYYKRIEEEKTFINEENTK